MLLLLLMLLLPLLVGVVCWRVRDPARGTHGDCCAQLLWLCLPCLCQA